MSGAAKSRSNGPGWAGVAVTLVFAVLALTVQWGVVTAKLDHVEKRLDELIVEARGLRSAYGEIERRVAYIEGRTGAVPAGGLR